MSDETPRLKLAELVSLQELNAVTWNEALAQLDALVDLYLLGQFVDAPPPSPQDGDAYLTGGAPTGAWTGHTYKIAACLDGGWRFYAPFDGLRAYIAPTGAFVIYRNGIWADCSSLISTAEVSLASAATCDLGAANALFVQITGNTTIASFGSAATTLRFVRFAQALTLTHNATSLILLGGASRTTAAGDVGVYSSDAGGAWRERSYCRAAIDAGDAATKSGSETLTNKTLAGAILSGTTTLPGSGTLSSSGRLGIGTASPSSLIHVAHPDIPFDPSSHVATALFIEPTSSSATPLSGTNYLIGSMTTPRLNTPVASGSTVVRGLQGSAYVQAGATGAVAELSGLVFMTYNYQPAGASIAAIMGIQVGYNHRSAGTVGSVYGLNYTAAVGGGTGAITTSYGLYLNTSALDPYTTTNYGVYQSGGNAKNYFAGSVGIGTASPNAPLDVAGHIFPHADNSYNLGSASFRFATVYAGTGTINTSGETEKTAIRALSADEIAVAADLARYVCLFQFRDAVARKGADGARLHAGMIAQGVFDTFREHNCDPFCYGICCRDPAVKIVARTRSVLGPDGEPAEEPYEECVPDLDENGAQKWVLGLRYDELAQFVIAGLAARLDALESRLP